MMSAVDQVAEMLRHRLGHRLDDVMATRLRRAVAEQAYRAGSSADEWALGLAGRPEQVQALVDAVTVQETSFFRDVEQFRALATEVLPLLPRPVRLWSAGCSTGQEAYTLAMVLAESGHGDAEIIASDVSSDALRRTRTGWYAERELRGLPPLHRARFLEAAGAGWRVRAHLRDMVRVLPHNLTQPPPLALGDVSVVFCRNVLIYFGQEEARAAISSIAGVLRPGGWLFPGFSETVWQEEERLALRRVGATYLYLRRDAGTPVIPTPAPPRAARPARPDVSSVLAAGEKAAGAGDAEGALRAFRRAVALIPDHPVALMRLGLALEGAGQRAGAVIAFSAARLALRRAGDETDPLLEGYTRGALAVLLDDRLGESR